MAAAAHHGEIHTDNALTDRCRHNVGVNISACCLNGLLMPHLSERGDAVAQMGGFFKLPGIRSSPLRETVQHDDNLPHKPLW